MESFWYWIHLQAFTPETLSHLNITTLVNETKHVEYMLQGPTVHKVSSVCATRLELVLKCFSITNIPTCFATKNVQVALELSYYTTTTNYTSINLKFVTSTDESESLTTHKGKRLTLECCS